MNGRAAIRFAPLLACCVIDAAAAPRLACDRPKYDFGTVIDQEAVEHAFRIGNTGDSELVIERVKTSCGCTTARLADKIVKPGEHVEIECRFTLDGRHGPQTKNVYVHSNDPEQSIYKLQITGTIRNEVDLTPGNAVFSSGQDDWHHAVRKSRLTFNSVDPHHITGVETNNAGFCRVDVSTVTDGREYEIAVALRSPDVLPEGSTTGTVTLLTDHPGKPRLEMRVYVSKRPEIYVVPPQLHLTAAASGRVAVKRYMLVRSNEGRPATLIAVEPPDDDITVEHRLLKPGVYRIELGNLVAREELDGKVLVVRLRKADGSEDTIEVPFKITWRPHG